MKQQETGRIIFLLPISSVVDTITNSSSELFVGVNPSKEMLEDALDAVYPEWRSEYNDLQSIDELDPNDLDMYFDFACSAHCWPATKDQYPVLPGFTFDELYEVDENDKSLHAGPQYRLKNNNKNPKHKWDRDFVTEENFEEIKDKLDPERKLHFLFSLGENPNWEMQEKLEKFMIRYHLG